MEIQWPLVLFSLAAGTGGSLFAFVGLSEFLGGSAKVRDVGAVCSLASQTLLAIDFGLRHLAEPCDERKKGTDRAESMAPFAQDRQFQDDDRRKDEQADRRLVEPDETVDRYGGRERQPDRTDQAKDREPTKKRRAQGTRQDHVASVELDTAASFLLNPRHGRARLCAFCRCRARGAARAAAMACLPTLSCSLSCLVLAQP